MFPEIDLCGVVCCALCISGDIRVDAILEDRVDGLVFTTEDLDKVMQHIRRRGEV